MTSQRKKVEHLIRSWNGQDAEQHSTVEELAAEIDREYEQYIQSLPALTAAVKNGQDANDRRVA